MENGAYLAGFILLLIGLACAFMAGCAPTKAKGIGASAVALVLGLSALAGAATSGHGKPVKIGVGAEIYEEGRVYQCYGIVRHPQSPRYDVLVGEPRQDAYWWQVDDVPSVNYRGFVQMIKDGSKYRLAAAEELKPEVPEAKKQ